MTDEQNSVVAIQENGAQTPANKADVNQIIDGVNNGDIHSDLSPEGAAVLVQSMALSGGITCAILAIVCVISAVVSSQDLREPTKNRHIACIILGAFSTGLATLGGIFGLIADSQDRRRAERQQE